MFSYIVNSINEFSWSVLFLPGVVLCGLLLTIRCGAVQFRHFGLAMRQTFLRMFKKSEAAQGSVTPMQAASTALASTVGTGNIVGTAQAIAMGGCGAVFWLWATALLSMVIKYSEVCLAIYYRRRNSAGELVGGPMYYIEGGLGRRFRPLAVCYALFAALAAFGMGNMAQINSAVGAALDAVNVFRPLASAEQLRIRIFLGLLLAGLLALILIGGVKRIGRIAESLIPTVSAVFILLSLIVIICHGQSLPRVLRNIVTSAFSRKAVFGATGGIAMREALRWGLRRSAFSNEAGLGSAAIAHAAADTDSAVRQGFWGIFEVFADTIVICSMTAFAILCSGVRIPWGTAPGAELLRAAFETVFGAKLSALFMSCSMALFAFSSVLGWSLYGGRCVQYIFGEGATGIYTLLFVSSAFFASFTASEIVWNLSDMFNVLMAVPNFTALFVLSSKLGRMTREYFLKPE